MNFTRNLEPKEAMGIGSIKTKISRALKEMYAEYSKTGQISNLKKYELTEGYVRKLIGSEVIVRLTGNKKKMVYGWNGGEKPNFDELVKRVVDYTVTRKTSTEIETNIISELTLILNDLGIQRDKIPDAIKKIQKVFQK